MTSTTNFLKTNYSTFTFDFDHYNQNFKPFVQTVVSFFKKTKPKKISLFNKLCYINKKMSICYCKTAKYLL